PSRTPTYSILLHYPPPPTHYTLSLHDALPISLERAHRCRHVAVTRDEDDRDLDVLAVQVLLQLKTAHAGQLEIQHKAPGAPVPRSEEHTSELQSRFDLVCRLLLEKKK